MDQSHLVTALKEEREANYHRVRGGFPLPLAGASYWLGLGICGYFLPLNTWLQVSFFATGLIFPMGVVYAKIFKNNFLALKQTVGSVLVPALIGMLLFWPMLIAAMQSDPQLAILILAIGMGAHWPVVGWMYNRTALFSAHAIVRAIISLGIWVYAPDALTTLLPFAIAAIYLGAVDVQDSQIS